MLYICQDGEAPSGVATYGRAMLRALQSSSMLLLNVDEAASCGNDQRRIRHISTSRSHDAGAIADDLRAMLSDGGRVTLLPNTGDTPWEATRLLLDGMPEPARRLVRVLGIVHSDMETQYALAERYLPIAPVWVGVSRRCAEELRRRIGPQGGCVHELPYPIESTPDISRGAAQDRILRLAYVGRLEEPQKRVSRLAAVLERLAASDTEFSATVAGDGPARGEFGERLRRAGGVVQQRVTITGALDRAGVAGIWRTHDVCVLASAYEGMPLALLEAMSAGVCPVVMAVDSGLPELLVDRVNARVVPQGDVSAMVEVLVELSRDRPQILRLGEAARETVRMRFSPEIHFRRLHEILDELWTMPPPDPSKVPPDHTASAVADIVQQAKRAAKPVAVFGAGMFGRKVVDACLAAGLEVAALVDSDPARRGWNYRGLACGGPDDLVRFSECAIAIGSLQFAHEMRLRVVDVFVARSLPCPQVVAAP